MSLLKLLKQGCHLKVQCFHFTSNLSHRKAQTHICDSHQRLNDPLCEKRVWTVSIHLRQTGDLMKLLTMPQISCMKRNVLDTTLFHYKTLTDQFGCTYDNDFITIKINPGSQRCQSTTFLIQLTTHSLFRCQFMFLIYSTLSTVASSFFLVASEFLSVSFYSALKVSVLLYYWLLISFSHTVLLISSSQFSKCSPFSSKVGNSAQSIAYSRHSIYICWISELANVNILCKWILCRLLWFL